MEIGYLIGYLGIFFGLFVAPQQLIRLIKRKSSEDISITSYLALCLAIGCYLIHAIYIKSVVFVIAQSINITFNTAIFIVLLRHKNGHSRVF